MQAWNRYNSRNTLSRSNAIASYLQDLRSSWEWIARHDPLWGVLSYEEKRGNKWDVETFFLTGRDQIAELVDFLNSSGFPPLKGRALDFGCGVGRLTRPIAGHVDECVGVDLSESMIQQAKSFHADEPKCRFSINESDDLSAFETGSFDFVFSSIVLQHMRPEMALKYIAEFVRVLRRGGLAVFQIPTRPGSLRSLLRSRLPFLARIYLAVKRTGYPNLELYHIPFSRVEHAVTLAGGIVLRTRRSPVAGELYESHEFFVTKQ